LTKGEILEIKNHPKYGYQILKEHTQYSDDILNAVLMHHEYDDSTGYPSKLKGKDIHLYAKIISVANLYSSITMDRIYKKTDTPFSVFEIFESTSANKFDPLVVYTLLNRIAMYYIGDKVQLTNGIKGQIIFIDQEFPSKPLILCEDGTTIDLRTEKKIKIAEIFI
jgi:HD-GYP domain-containing protein (c-di-GMP phosphodiesterase class II)